MDQLPTYGATYQKGQLGLVSALNAFCVKFALLEAAMHDVHGTRHPSLDILEGGGREAHPQLVAQNVSGREAEWHMEIDSTRSCFQDGGREGARP